MANILNNRISVTLTDEQMTSVKEAFETINQTMDFLLALTPSERATLPKISTSNKLFVEDAIYSVQTNSNVLPNYIEAEEMVLDLKLYRQLDELQVIAENLAMKMRDTQMLAGSEAYSAALMIYRMYDAAAKAGVPNAQSAYNMLKERFKTHAAAKQPEPETV